MCIRDRYNCRSISSRPLASALRFLGMVQRRRLRLGGIEVFSPGAAPRNGARAGFGRAGFGRAGEGSLASSVLATGATGDGDGGRPSPEPAARARRGEICGPQRSPRRKGRSGASPSDPPLGLAAVVPAGQPSTRRIVTESLCEVRNALAAFSRLDFSASTSTPETARTSDSAAPDGSPHLTSLTRRRLRGISSEQSRVHLT